MKKSYMQEAILEARKGIDNQEGGPFGTVIVKDGEIVGRGHNQVLLLKDPTCHGEVQAIRAACKALGTHDLSGCVLYTTGEPCPMCMAACMWANIEKVYFGCTVEDNADIGFRDEQFYARLYDNKDGDNGFTECLDRDSCLQLFEDYKSQGHKKY